MTHKYAIGDELDFEDHRWQTSRALRVRVARLIGQPHGYTVTPVPSGREIAAFEDELSRPRDEPKLQRTTA